MVELIQYFIQPRTPNEPAVNNTPPENRQDTAGHQSAGVVMLQQPEKKQVVIPVTPHKQATPKALIPEALNGAVFDSLASSNSIRIYDIQKNTCAIAGRLCGYQVTARLSFDGTTFRTISGDVQGSFSLYDNDTKITGSLMVKSSKMPCPITFTRR